MRLGVRGKLFAASLLLIAGVGLICLVYLEFSLRSWLETRAEFELWRQARTARDILEMTPGASTSEAMSALAWRLGDSTGARVTLISPQGGVLADSEMSESRLDRAENHLRRQEVRDAFRDGHGMTRRFSNTLQTPMLYAALPFSRPDVHGVVRVAMSLAQVDSAVQRLRFMLMAAALVGLGAALFIGGLASHYASRALRDLLSHAQRTARGEVGRRLAAWPEDEIGGIAGSFNQIADNLERAVSALGHERDQVAAILESMSEAVIAFDAEHRITLINGAASELLGASGEPVDSLMQAADNTPLRGLVARATAGAACRDELCLGERRVLARATPLCVSRGSVLVMHDITDLRRLETVRRDFIANVSHELRTPVSVIRATAETLVEGALEDPQAARPFAQALLRNAERLGRLIADLLDISRVEAGQLQLRQQKVSLAVAARRAAEALQRPAAEKDLVVQVALEEHLSATGDLQAIDQVLLNLLDNAIKYTPAGGRVVVSGRLCGSNVRVEVADNGPGLAPAHRRRIFERFYRVDPGRSRDMGGTGLGLSIVKNLCEAMGGRVGVEGGPQGGSIFWFHLPVSAINSSEGEAA